MSSKLMHLPRGAAPPARLVPPAPNTSRLRTVGRNGRCPPNIGGCAARWLVVRSLPMDITTDTIPGTSRRRLLWIAAIGFTLMLVVGFVAHYLRANLDSTTPGWDALSALASLIYADGEANLWAWASGLLLAAIGLSLAAIGFAVRNERASSVPYFLLAAVAVVLSADEIAQLHEELARFDLGSRFT